VHEFIARENIKRFEDHLRKCTDAGVREILEQLLAEERAKLCNLTQNT
jgi:hypothetical protein